MWAGCVLSLGSRGEFLSLPFPSPRGWFLPPSSKPAKAHLSHMLPFLWFSTVWKCSVCHALHDQTESSYIIWDNFISRSLTLIIFAKPFATLRGWLRWWRIHLQCRILRFDPWVGQIPWREWLPTPELLPGEPHGQRSLAGYGPWSHKESDTIEQLTVANLPHKVT